MPEDNKSVLLPNESLLRARAANARPWHSHASPEETALDSFIAGTTGTQFLIVSWSKYGEKHGKAGSEVTRGSYDVKRGLGVPGKPD